MFKVKENSVVSFAEIFSRLPLVFTIGYLAEIIGPNAFGNWGLILVIHSIVSYISNIGAGESIARLLPSSKKENAHVLFYSSFSKSILLIVIFFFMQLFFGQQIADLINIGHEYSDLIPFSVLLSLGVISDTYLDKYLKARRLVWHFVFFSFSRSFAEILAIFILFLYFSVSNPNEIIKVYVASIFITKLISYSIILLTIRVDVSKFKIEKSEKRNFVSYGLLMMPSIGLVIVTQNLDRLLLSNFSSTYDLGVYTFYGVLASYLVLVSYISLPLFQSSASQYFDSGNNFKLHSLFNLQQTIFLNLSFVILFLVIVFSEFLITFIAGENYAKHYQFFVIFAIAGLIEQYFSIYQFGILLKKRVDLVTTINTIRMILAIFLFYFMSKFFSFAGAVWSLVILSSITAVMKYKICKRVSKISFSINTVRQIFLSIILLFLTYLVSNELHDFQKFVLLFLILVVGINIGFKNFNYCLSNYHNS